MCELKTVFACLIGAPPTICLLHFMNDIPEFHTLISGTAANLHTRGLRTETAVQQHTLSVMRKDGCICDTSGDTQVAE